MTEETYQKILKQIENMSDADYQKLLEKAKKMDKDLLKMLKEYKRKSYDN